MDIFVLSLFLSLALICVALDFWKKAFYLSVFGGVILVFLGIFMSIDVAATGGITKAFCVSETTLANNTIANITSYTSQVACTNQPLPVFQENQFGIALGAMLMFLGAAVSYDSLSRMNEKELEE